MNRAHGVVVLVVIVLLLSVGPRDRADSGTEPLIISALQHRDDPHLRLQWLGVSGWILSRGRDVVVVDPFFSRPPIWRVFASLFGATFEPDERRIRAVLPTLPDSTRFVLIGHAHYDHLMDLGYYVRSAVPQPTYIGSRTALNILQGWNPASLDFVVADEPPQLGHPIRSGHVVVTPFLSNHAPHFAGLTLMAGEVAAPRASPPSDAWDYRLGRTLMYVVDFLDERDQVAHRVFINSAASDPDVARGMSDEFLSRHPVDVVILCVPGWNKVSDYPESLLDRLQPAQVALSHYDDFFQPYVNGEDPTLGMRFVVFAEYEDFLEKLAERNRTRGKGPRIIQSRTGETICVDC